MNTLMAVLGCLACLSILTAGTGIVYDAVTAYRAPWAYRLTIWSVIALGVFLTLLVLTFFVGVVLEINGVKL